MSINVLLPLMLFCFTTSITPGPNNIMIMSSGLRFGVVKSIPHYLGICLGFNIMVFLVGLGLGKVFDIIPVLHAMLKYIGASYMLYLSYKIIKSNGGFGEKDTKSIPLRFFEAVLFQWVNPKAWIMAIGVFSTYSLQNGNMFYQSAIIAFIFFIIGIPCIGFWLISGVFIRKYLSHPKAYKYFNYITGTLLALSVITVFIE